MMKEELFPEGLSPGFTLNQLCVAPVLQMLRLMPQCLQDQGLSQHHVASPAVPK